MTLGVVPDGVAVADVAGEGHVGGGEGDVRGGEGGGEAFLEGNVGDDIR